MEEQIPYGEEKALTIEPETEIVPVSGTPNGLLELALSKGAGVETLEKLMDLKERSEANEARKAYVRAMTAFKTNPPEILKDTHVEYKTKAGDVTSYDHASLATVSNAIGSALSEHGLSVSWKTRQTDGPIVVTCVITHEEGHSESTSLSATADTSGGKNAIQGIGSTVTYLQRYTLLSLVGLATQGQDDDGKGSEPEAVITEEECADLKALREEVGADGKRFLSRFGIEKLEDLPAKQYGDAVKELEKKRK